MICQSLSPTDHYHNEIFNKKLYQKFTFVRTEKWPLLERTDQSSLQSCTQIQPRNQARDLKLTDFLPHINVDFHTILISCCIFSSLSKESVAFQLFKHYRWSPKNLWERFLRRFSWNGSYADWQFLAWVAIPLWYTRYSIVLRHLSWQSNLLSFKSGHCHGKGNNPYLYLCLHGWWLWN